MAQPTTVDTATPTPVHGNGIADNDGHRAGGTGRAATAARVAAVASVLAGLIHYTVIPEHRGEWWVYAAFFTLLGAFQVVWAAAAWTACRRALPLGIAVNAAVVVLWAVTRTAGLPFGPDAGQAEAVGVADVLCVLAEAVTITGAALAVLRGRFGTVFSGWSGIRAVSRRDGARRAGVGTG